MAIDQCERVIDKEPQNAKACFRLAQAIYQKYNCFSDTAKCQKQLFAAHSSAAKAKEVMPNDKKLLEFFQELD